ncbi:MAG: hypothetical protein K9M08_17965 [Pirellula sp.]|nr:hypothetical protein [Pirellula sp.]
MKERQIEDKNGWPLLDRSSENHRLLRKHLSASIENNEPRKEASERLTVVSTQTVRAIIEPVSAIQFCMRGYLLDLSKEQSFAIKVIDFQRKNGLVRDNEGALDKDESQGNVEGRENDEASKNPLLKIADAMPSYAGVAYPKSRCFVGELSFSDFACFELDGFITNQEEVGWKDAFLKDLRKIVELISPQQ